MSAERSLFDDTILLEDLVRLVQRLADSKGIAYHSSFGMSKNRLGAHVYSAMMLITTHAKKEQTKIIEAPTFRKLFEEIKDFLTTL